MIFDKLENWPLYFKEGFKEIIDAIHYYIERDVLGEFAISDEAFIKVMTYDTKLDNFVIESHKTYVDFQYVYVGQERIDIFNSESLDIKVPYQSDTDCIFYVDPHFDPHSSLVLGNGYFSVFFPGDVHRPQMTVGNPERLKKIVVKIHEKFFSRS